MTWEYGTIAKLKETFANLGSFENYPLRVLVVGTGNVGGGAVEVCEWLGLPRIDKARLQDAEAPEGSWYSVVRTADVVRAKDGSVFDFNDYREHGVDKYESCFDRYLGHFNVLLQTPYWEPRFPKMLPRETMLAHPEKLPAVVGDISCDIDGSLECTRKASIIDEPAFSYDPKTHEIRDGIEGEGLSVMSIDHLPCELSQDASEHFSRILVAYLPELVNMDRTKSFESCGLGRLLADATIVYNGELTPNYDYLKSFLAKAD
jgi:alpha-aminoadipic semialdehyde synthase